MRTLRVGAASIDRVEEQYLPVPITVLTNDEAFIARRIEPLPSGFLERASMTFQLSNHSWILRVDGLRVLIDPCTGNGRQIGQAPFFDNLNTPYLERLAEVGAPPDTIDVVFCTHLHHDHCGWNVMQADDRWVPTFSNAEYVFVDEEYRRWDSANPDRHPNDFNPNVFDTCVRPVVEAGQAKVVALPHNISSSVRIEPAPGHTTGHAVLHLVSDGVRAYFTGDAFHHPAQITRPELHLPGCDDLTAAIATRHALIRRALQDDAFVFPAHFSTPHYGRLGVDGDEVCFLPGGAEEYSPEPR